MSDMEREVRRLWGIAKQLEEAGDHRQMLGAYEAIVQVDPIQPAAWLKIAQISMQMGPYRDSRDASLRAAEAVLIGKRWRGLPYAAQQLLHYDERTLISELVRQADWNAPEVISQSVVLAQALSLADDSEAALSLLDVALAKLPPHYLLHHSRAEVLAQLGRVDEAAGEYERAISIEPRFPHAHRALAYTVPAPNPGSRVPRVEAALREAKAANDAAGEIELHYALFKELDHAGQVDAAFGHLESGANKRRQTQKFDSDAAARDIDALIDHHRTHRSASQNQRPAGHRQSHLFIVGMPRTGTTVLERMFGNHPHVGSAGELNAFSRALSWEADQYYEPPPNSAILGRLANIDWRAVGSRYADLTKAVQPDKPVLLDKNPLNLYNAGFIAEAIPQARILCLLRNPMDACFSNMKELFAKGSYAYSYDQQELAEHYVGFLRLARYWEKALPDHFKVVDYEELVTAPERVLQGAMSFCGLDCSPEYADIMRNQTPVSTASRAQVRAPVSRRGIGAWRRYEAFLQPLRNRLIALGVDVDGETQP